MKCLSYRIGAEFHNEDDIRFLLRLLELRTYNEAIEVIKKYYPLERFPQKTLYALAELLPKEDTSPDKFALHFSCGRINRSRSAYLIDILDFGDDHGQLSQEEAYWGEGQEARQA